MTWPQLGGCWTSRTSRRSWWAIRTAGWSSPKRGPIHGSWDWSTSAFAPDAGESVATLIQDPPPGAPVPPILPPQEGYLLLDRSKFAASFAADVNPDLAGFMADSQVPWGIEALGGKVSRPTWKSKPSWYLVATEDRMIPPPAQRAMAGRAGATVSEVAASHSVYISQAKAVIDLVARAAKEAAAAHVTAG